MVIPTLEIKVEILVVQVLAMFLLEMRLYLIMSAVLTLWLLEIRLYIIMVMGQHGNWKPYKIQLLVPKHCIKIRLEVIIQLQAIMRCLKIPQALKIPLPVRMHFILTHSEP